MKVNVKSLGMLTLVLVMASLSYAEFIFAYSSTGTELGRFTSDLDTKTTLVSGIGGITDIAVGSDGIYMTTGTTVMKSKLQGGTGTSWLLDTSYASTYRTVTVGTDGNVYAYNGSDIVRMASNNLKAQDVIRSGFGGQQDVTATTQGLYFSDNYYVRRVTYTGAYDMASYQQGARVLQAATNGYIYARTSNQTLMYDPNNLLSFAIVHEYGTASELLDFNGNPIWRNSQITDVAVSLDGNYFYAADGTYIWKFNIAGGRAIDRSDAGGYTKIFVAVPEPATMALLGLGVIGLLRRKKG